MLFRRATLFLKLAITCAALSACAILLLPLCGAFDDNTKSLSKIILPVVFWGGFAMELIFFGISNAIGKKLRKQILHGKRLRKAPLGIAAFGSNKEARICDIILCAAAVLMVGLLLGRVRTAWLVTLSVALLFLSFNLHCILNGRHYRQIKLFRRIKKTDRKK